MLTISRPARKKGIYISKITRAESTSALRIKIPFARFVNQTGNILRVWVPTESSVNEDLEMYEAECLATTMKCNREWFANALEIDKIQSFFRKSISNNTFAVLVSDVRPPDIFYGQDRYNSPLPTLQFNKDHVLTLELEAQGLCFMTTKFGIRWILRTLNVEEDIPCGEDHPFDIRSDIEDEWTSVVAKLHEDIERDISEYQARIEVLTKLKSESAIDFTRAKEAQDFSGWETALSNLKTNVAKYHNGMIFICNKI